MKITRRADANWDITFGQGINNYAVNQEACAQNVRARLQVIAGEWFLDTSQGVYNPTNMQPPADLPLLESRAKACIIQTEDVAELVSFNLTFDRQSRKLTMDVVLTTVYGTTEQIQVRTP